MHLRCSRACPVRRWLLAVDVDEFATTRRHRDKTLAAELRDSFSDVDVVDVRSHTHTHTHTH